VFLTAWVFMSCLAKEVFRGNRGLMLAGICMASLASLCFASFVSGAVQAVGKAMIDPYGALQLAQLAMFYFFVAGMLAVIGVFLFFAVTRAARTMLLRIRVWRVRARMKRVKKCVDKAGRLMKIGVNSHRVGALLEEAKGYSDEAEWLMDKMQGMDGPKPQRRERKKAGTANRRLKRKTVQRKKNGYIEWRNED